MTCDQVFQAILEAEPHELAGEGDGPLARHLGSCLRCRSAAQVVLAEEGEMGSALGALVPEPDLDQILAQIVPAGGSGKEALEPTPPTSLERRKTLRRRLRVASFRLVPLAMAAGLAALFLAREPQLPGDPFVSTPQAPGLDVEVPEGRNVAVLETNNPDITVLWLF